MSLGNGNVVTGLAMISINGVFHQLNKYDVLGGRGGFVYRQNKVYRSLVQSNKISYATCQDKKQKKNISRSIVTALYQKGGRFYCQENDNSDSWYEIGENEAIKKTSQALREGQPDLLSNKKSTLESPTSTMDLLPISSIPTHDDEGTNPYFIPSLTETGMIREASGQPNQQEQMNIEAEVQDIPARGLGSRTIADRHLEQMTIDTPPQKSSGLEYSRKQKMDTVAENEAFRKNYEFLGSSGMRQNPYFWQHSVFLTSSIGTFSCSCPSNESMGQHHQQEQMDIVDELESIPERSLGKRTSATRHLEQISSSGAPLVWIVHTSDRNSQFSLLSQSTGDREGDMNDWDRTGASCPPKKTRFMFG